jgi:hypothetical protein
MIEIVSAIERRHSAHDKMAVGPKHGEFLAERRHETRPVSRQDETIHPRELCYLHDFPIAFLALELSRPRIAGNLRFCIK